MFSNCNKDGLDLVPDNEVPQWLNERIATDMAEITKSDPKMMINYGAWVRYEFEAGYYFEYDNPLSSVCCYMINFEGESFNYFDESFETYHEDKCCKRFVWKAWKYDDIH